MVQAIGIPDRLLTPRSVARRSDRSYARVEGPWPGMRARSAPVRQALQVVLA
jgi:hypothetical protein